MPDPLKCRDTPPTLQGLLLVARNRHYR